MPAGHHRVTFRISDDVYARLVALALVRCETLDHALRYAVESTVHVVPQDCLGAAEAW
jgi:predicted transcriptional regulator